MNNMNCHKTFLIIAFAIGIVGSMLVVDSSSIMAAPVLLQEKEQEKKSDDKKSDDQDAKPDKQEKSDKDDSDTDGEDKSDRKQSDEKKQSEKSDDQDDSEADEKETKKSSTRRKGSKRRGSKKRLSKRGFSKQDDSLVDLFKPVVGSAAASTVRVLGGRRQIAIGAIVDSDGYVITKASEMRGELKCKLSDGKSYEAKVVGIDKETDLALLKIEVENLPAVNLSSEPPPAMGKWLVTPLGYEDAVSIGVVAVNAREIPPSRAFVGIQMDPKRDKPGVRITSVVPDSPADTAGIFISDIIMKVDDVDVMNLAGMHETLGQFSPEQTVTLTVRRGDEIIKLKLTLADKSKASPDNARSNTQNRMGSSLSRRSKNFELAFQHDSMLQANQCGGPIVDLSGQVVGFNIARAGRVSSLAIPVAQIPELVERLKTGEFAPEIINREKITGQVLQIAETEKELVEIEEKVEDLSGKMMVEKARIEELEKVQQEIAERVKKMKASIKLIEKSYSRSKAKTKNKKYELKRLKDYLDGLKSGQRY